MDCREAKRRLKDLVSPAEADHDLRAHASSCPSCRQAWDAALLLEHAFETSRGQSPLEPVPSLWETRRAVEERLARRSWSPLQWVSDFWKFGTAGVRWGVSAGAFALVLAFVTLVPFHYEKTVGYEVALAGVDPELARHEDRLQTLLAAMGAGQANVNWVHCDSVCELRVTDLPDLEQCRLLVSALEELCEVKVLESGARMCVASTGPILEMAVERVRNTRSVGASETDAKELLAACFGGDFSLCTQVTCDSAMAAACAATCKAGASCLVTDSLCIVVCPAAGTSCGPNATAAPSCLPGSCMTPQARGTESGAMAAGDEPASMLPSGFDLAQNQPNPFNPATEIAFSLVSSMDVRLEIFNSLGRRVRTLVDGVRSAGVHTVTWDGRSDLGVGVPSGTYLYRLSAGDEVQSKTMTLLK